MKGKTVMKGDLREIMTARQTGEGQAVGYLRVSTDKQDLENQRVAINAAAAKEGLKVDFVQEVISSRKTDRAIFKTVEGMTAGQTLIVYELSRVGR